METYDPHRNKNDVRQGSPRKMNMRVLVTSLIGVVILFLVLYIAYFIMQPPATT